MGMDMGMDMAGGPQIESFYRIVPTSSILTPVPPDPVPSRSLPPISPRHLGLDLHRPNDSWCRGRWRGLRDAKLVEASGIPGGKFVHATGFIGGNATFEGALQMALTTIEAAK